MAKEAFRRKEQLLRSKMKLDMKKFQVKYYILYIILHKSEIWTLTQRGKEKLVSIMDMKVIAND